VSKILFCYWFLFYFFNEASAQSNKADIDASLSSLIAKNFQFDSAVLLLKRTAQQAKVIGYKSGEARAYDLLGEKLLSNGRIKEIIVYDSLLLPLAQQLKDSNLLINYYNRSGVYFLERGNNSMAEKMFVQALASGLEKKQSTKTAEVYSNLGSLFLAKGEKEKASSEFFKSLRLYEANNSVAGMAETYSNIASVFYLSGKIDDAIQYQKTSIGLRTAINDKKGLANSQLNIGQLFILKQDYPQAISFIADAVKNAEAVNNPRMKASSYAAMSVYYLRTKNYTEALNWQTKAINLFEEIDDKTLLSRMYVAAGGLANASKDSLATVRFFEKGLGVSKELGNKENIANAYEKLSSFYFSRGNFKDAYSNYQQYIIYKDSVKEKSNIAKIEEVKTLYETEKKDNEIVRLNTLQRLKQLEIEKQQALLAGNELAARQKQSEIELLSNERELLDLRMQQQTIDLEKQVAVTKTQNQELQILSTEKILKEKELKNQRLFRNLILAGMALVLITGVSLFSRFRLKRKIAEQKALLAVRNTISKDLHDDIGASLTNIGILNEMARRNLDKPEKSTNYLVKASEDIQRISESLSDIVWNINPRFDTAEGLFARMQRYAADILEGASIQTEISFPSNEQSLNLSMQQRRDFYLIFKEAVNNLAKYSKATKAEIGVISGKGNIQLLVKDNGVGFSVKENKIGNGLHNMQQRALALGAQLDIKTAKDIGTEITLILSS
jgi:two-component system, NarL family, sensor histidine kinase UhpB